MASPYRRNNSNVWWVRFQSNGVRVQRSSGSTRRADAMRFLARAMEEERQRQGQDPIKVRFDRLCDEYRSQHLVVLKPRTQLNYLGHLQAFADHFGDRCIDDIRKVHIADVVAQKKREGLKPPTIRRYLATLSSLFSFAVRRGWLESNPLLRFDRRSLPEAAPRTRFLTHEEYRRLLAMSDEHLRPLLTLAVATGIRLEELLSLRWEQVALDRRELRLTITKSKRPRVVPLSDQAVAILVAAGPLAAPERTSSPIRSREIAIGTFVSHSRPHVVGLASRTSGGTTFVTRSRRGPSNLAPTSIP